MSDNNENNEPQKVIAENPPPGAPVAGPITSTVPSANVHAAAAVINLPAMSPDWTYRRKLIFRTVNFIGGCVGFIVFCTGLLLLISPFRPGFTLDNNIASIAQTLIYNLVGACMAMIGAYVFGAAYEGNGFRGKVMNLVAGAVPPADNGIATQKVEVVDTTAANNKTTPTD